MLQAEACNFIKKETQAQLLSCQFCKISQNTSGGCFCLFPVKRSVYLTYTKKIRYTIPCEINYNFTSWPNNNYIWDVWTPEHLSTRGVLWKKLFLKIHRKTSLLVSRNFFIKVKLATLLKRGSNTGTFLWILQKF